MHLTRKTFGSKPAAPYSTASHSDLSEDPNEEKQDP